MNQTGVRSTVSRRAARTSSGADEAVEVTARQSRRNDMADLRVGIDVSPLELTEAGTARYLRNLVAHLDGVAIRRFVVAGDSRLQKVTRDVFWYPATLPRKAAREDIEVLHCPGHRAPLRSSVPVVVTLHDLAVVRHPATFNRWTRTYSRLLLPRIVDAA